MINVPVGWEVKRLGDVANVVKGRGLSKDALDPLGSSACILYGELFTKYERVIDAVVSKTHLAEGLLGQRGDVLMPGSTTTKGIDLAVASALLVDGVLLGGDINVVRMKNEAGYDPVFMANLLTYTQKATIADSTQGTTIIHLYGKNLLHLMLNVPPLPEQQRIGTILSDMDAHANAMARLLAKKKAVKAAMAEELLTGKRRLEGFSGAWEVRTIQEIAQVGRGRVISHFEISKSFNPIYPVFSSQTLNDGIMGYLNTYDFEGDYVTWTTDGAYAGTVFARSGKFSCTNVCGILKLHDADHRFIAAALGRATKPHVSRHLGNPKLMNDVMKKIQITIPGSRAEQTAIATILSDMDADIHALAKKLEKHRKLKEAMAHQLLTGAIRV